MTAQTDTARTIDALHDRIAAWREAGEVIGFVATMGSLHEGHLALVRHATAAADRVIVSIFVNPTQFGPNEDLDTYPRDEAGDRAKLAQLGVDLIYAPSPEEMYPPGFSTRIEVSGLSDPLCGDSRPQFFSGVATVVAKLLLQVMPDVTVFGEKDYQQLLVIRRMVRDLDMPVEVASAPTVREADGVALSSRNAYLSDAERTLAPLLYRTLSDTAEDIAAGRAIDDAVQAGRDRLAAAGFRIDYFEVRETTDLEAIARLDDRPARVFAAAFLGRTRLIDNVAIENV